MFMKFLKRALLTLAVLLGIFAIIVAMQPADYKITRSATMSAPAEVVFAQINDFHNWDAWSPWAKLDPNVKNTFEGPASGTGAMFSWVGNDQVGVGKMTITDSKPNEHIGIKLEFKKPYEDSSNVDYNFKSEGDKTAVTWSMDGKKNFVAKAMCMFMDMDKMVGGQFEQGLSKIKEISEAKSKK